jgi:gamma-glutamyltranspeptidase/glutathione hydrolase
MVSLIQSNYMGFGSGVVVPGYGISLQNRGHGFSLDAGSANVVAPGKRPFHTIIPGLALKAGKPTLAVGVMGGQYQATGHAHILSAVVDRRLDIQAASDLPRSFAFDGTLQLEPTVSQESIDILVSRGHRTMVVDEPLGGCQAIYVDHERGVMFGATDHRKDGVALAV